MPARRALSTIPWPIVPTPRTATGSPVAAIVIPQSGVSPWRWCATCGIPRTRSPGRWLRQSSTLNRTCPQPRGWQLSGTGKGQGALLGADDIEVLADEDVVRPVHSDVVDLVIAVAQLHDTVNDAPRVGGQRSFRRPIGCRSADDRPRSLTVARRDLTDLL